jgi:hypothetical protein
MAVLVGMALAGHAQAANVTVNETIDLGASLSPSGGSSWFGWRDFTTTTGRAFSPEFSYQLAAGDTLDFKALFAPGQTLTLTNPSSFWLFSYATDGQGTDVNGTGSLTLLSSTGAPLFTSSVVTDTEGSVHFGQYFSAGSFTSLPNTLTIGGLEYDGTLNYYVDPSVTVRTYADPQVVFSAGGYSVSGVPEPSTWVMMLLGFGAVGLGGYRRASKDGAGRLPAL